MIRYLNLCIPATMVVYLVCTAAPAAGAGIPLNRSAGEGPSGGRRAVNFNGGWKFSRGEQPGASAADYDDTRWAAVRLPHDWAIAGPFNPRENGYAGKLPWKGMGWYRKTFTLDRTDAGRRVYLDFDGAMAFPRVYVNGQLAGEWDYGYMSFRVDATRYVKFGGRNVIAVLVDTSRHGTRWYPGAGIYRKVTMTICEPVHLAHWGTFVTTPQVSDSSARVRIQTGIRNFLQEDAAISIAVTILDSAVKSVARAGRDLTVPGEGSGETEFSLPVNHPRRWDLENPRRYTARLVVKKGNVIVDTEEVRFGIRTFQFTANDGFHLNGRRVQLHGVNLHHDHGPLGAAFYTRAMERQLEIMKDMGCNAIRTSHNPPAPELLELCDRMGLVVWNECFDKWNATAGRVRGEPPLEEYGHRQIRNFVMRDRNHPCVVVWSIGNEIGNQPRDREGKSPRRVKMLRDFVLRYDPTRPVGMACHIPGTADQPILDALDLTGWNYSRRYARYRERYPDKPIIYSESASALSTRGFYELPLPDGKTQFSRQLQVSSYDLNAASWSDIPDAEFQLMADDSFVAGEFVWTGFDYLGEPTPFNQDARSSYFGIVDLCGIPKDRFYLYRSHWRPDVATVHILPHWNWPDRIGKKVPVFVYTSGDSAELFLNGRSLGRRSKGQEPERAINLARNRPATASSEEKDRDNGAGHASDGKSDTRWCAATGDGGQWWQVDLGQESTIRFLALEFEREAKNYGYRVKASTDASSWKTIASKETSRTPRWGGPRRQFHEVETGARYLRIEFTALQGGAWASIREFGAYPEWVESDYYTVTYHYRLRWNDVVHEPGELKAVAYRNGRQIGQALRRTAGKPFAIRLTPDRSELAATGCDLSYVLVEAVDEKGTPCPLADDLIRFTLEGPAEIAGVGNGNPLSLEPFQANHRKLFNGKAMVILRSLEGKPGRIRFTAGGDGLREATALLRANEFP